MTNHEAAEREAMRRALQLAATPGLPLGPNPRVGCVLLAPDGGFIAQGHHRGAGTAHAEVAALASAGEAARGSTAVVTLEPCNHLGRTGPCVEALLAAGVRRVVFAQRDPNPLAQGGAAALRSAGVEVEEGLMAEESRHLNRAWTFGIRHGRPLVTWKLASTLDGYSAAPDGSSKWISNRSARSDTHRLRAECDVILVGTNTVTLDDPQLTVRDDNDQSVAHQPLRVVVGLRNLPPSHRVFDEQAETWQARTHDPGEVLAEVFARGRRHVFLEGGPTLAAAFFKAGLVDEVVAYVAPMLLGGGRPAVADLGVTTLSEATHLRLLDATVLPGSPEVTGSPGASPETAGEQREDATVRLIMTPERRADVHRNR